MYELEYNVGCSCMAVSYTHLDVYKRQEYGNSFETDRIFFRLLRLGYVIFKVFVIRIFLQICLLNFRCFPDDRTCLLYTSRCV